MCKETRFLMNEQQTSSFTPAALQIDELRSQEFLLHLLKSIICPHIWIFCRVNFEIQRWEKTIVDGIQIQIHLEVDFVWWTWGFCKKKGKFNISFIFTSNETENRIWCIKLTISCNSCCLCTSPGGAPALSPLTFCCSGLKGNHWAWCLKITNKLK